MKTEERIPVPPAPSDKAALRSKKFLAFLIAEVTWKIVVGLELHFGASSVSMMLTVVVAGFTEAVYIGGVAALDAYTHVIRVAIPQKDEADP